METLTHPEVEIDNRKSMDSWQIKSQLAEIGVPYIEVSWTDSFLISENLQNYFAEIIAGYSLLELQEENKEKPNLKKLKELENSSLDIVHERRKYHQYNLKETQQLLLWLMKESKKVEQLRKNEL
jgi:isopropylmalate/homocitrate/citramalate synthase